MKVKIHCFEGEWDNKHSELSVRPLIHVLEQAYLAAGKQLTYSYKFCQSMRRLRDNLKLDGRVFSKSTYRHCLYFAFHGDSSGLWSFDGSETMSFTEIAAVLGQKAAGGIIFFGSCGTRMTESELSKFKSATNADLVVGYGSNVDWLQSSMYEMLFFSELCRYKQLGSFVSKMKKASTDSIFSKLRVQIV